MPHGGSLFVRGGSVVTEGAILRVDIRIRDGTITEIGADLRIDAEPLFDADGLTVLPGAIDPHAHQWEPSFTSPADFLDATSSAAFGGVTTILDHPLTPPTVVDMATFRDKVALGERTSIVDFGLHVGASPAFLSELPALWRAGATGVKVFTCRTGTALDGFETDAALRSLFEGLAAIGALALVHAEDQAVLDQNAAELRLADRTGPEIVGAWRTRAAETTAVERVVSLAARTGVRLYLVHASSPEAVDLVGRAVAAKRLRASVETCPHYLHLDDRDLARQAGCAATAPPVRDAEARNALIDLVADGRIDTVGSDHCAVSLAAKKVEDVFDVVLGVPGLDLFVPLMLDLAAQGRFDLVRLAEVQAQVPARIFGIGDRKGAIRVGLDGDLVVVDPAAAITVRAATLPGSAGWSPYEGRTLRGRVIATVLRGSVVAREGAIIGRPGSGRFVARR